MIIMFSMGVMTMLNVLGSLITSWGDRDDKIMCSYDTFLLLAIMMLMIITAIFTF